MTPAIRYTLLSIGICALFALTGGLLTGSGLEQWYIQLQQPSFGLSMEGWILAAFLYYIVCGIVLYRLFRVTEKPGKALMIIMFLGLMALNEGWNFTLFGLQSPASGFFALIPLLVYALWTWWRLWRFDKLAATALTLYILWLLYAFAWVWSLFKING